jgi:hypothetical protein
MNDIQKRFVLFLFGCILVRSFFVIIAKNNLNYLPLMGYISFIPAIGFFYIYMFDKRKTGNEVFGEKIWWNDLRPIHGLLYASFGLYALQKNSDSWKILLLDVIIGLVGFLHFHYTNNNFNKLFC